MKYFKKKEDDLEKLIHLTGYFLGIQIFSMFFNRYYNNILDNTCISAVSELISIIFEKIFKIFPSYNKTKTKLNESQILNHIQVDAFNLAPLIRFFSSLFVSPFQIVYYNYLLFDNFGFVYLFGFVVLIITFIINLFLCFKYGKIEKDYLIKKDQRMKITAQIFDNLKLLKMYVWEEEFKKKVKIFFLE